MELRRFDDIETFADRVRSHLAAHEAEHNLEFGIIEAIRAGRYAATPPLLVSVEDGGAVLGVAIRTPPHGLLLSAKLPGEAVNAVATWLLESDDPVSEIPGVQAEQGVAASFVEAWHASGGAPMAAYREERIYRLTGVRRLEHTPAGTMRPIRDSDGDLLREWVTAFAIDTGEPDPADPAEAVDRLLESPPSWLGMCLWEVDGEPRSMAGHSGPTPNGIRVGPVYTPPSERRNGYAGALVAALTQHLLDEGRQFCFLFTDLANPTSNHIYRAIGYEPVCDVTQYRVGNA